MHGGRNRHENDLIRQALQPAGSKLLMILSTDQSKQEYISSEFY
jgi:hypothetical protein